jgi:NAD(P)-dependent dehydrogenase (short-subunit alcohol dehydrogenase family)
LRLVLRYSYNTITSIIKESLMNEKSIFDLSGRVALVTGGGSGLGRAFCESMAKYGADVACVGRTEQKLKETVELVGRFGHKGIAIKADVSRPDEVDHMVNEAVSKLGTIDILFNNAGITHTATRVGETPVEDWDRVIATNLSGVFLCMRAVLPIMLKQRRGSVINISSIGAYGGAEPEVSPAAYGASKAGVIALTKFAAVEYAKDGIRINSIAPGMHHTDLGVEPDPVLAARREQFINELVSMNIPMGRLAEPAELEGLAVFLASDASSFVTGQVFVQDGGQLAKI